VSGVSHLGTLATANSPASPQVAGEVKHAVAYQFPSMDSTSTQRLRELEEKNTKFFRKYLGS